MSQFFGTNYLKPQYFDANYLHGAQQETNTGRSGYWRLFYTQLQEESLKKDAELKKSEEKVVEVVAPEVIAPIKAKPKKKSVPKKVVEEVVVHERPLLPEKYNIEIPLITPFLSIISMEFRSWLITSEPIRIALLQREAANDHDAEEEENIHLLLMAA